MTIDTPQPAGALPRPARRLRATALGIAVLASSLSIWASASLFHRPLPRPPASSPGLTIEKSSITVSSGAPEWRVLKVGEVSAAGSHLSDPIPARVRLDESRASRVGCPLAGRVTRVFVDLNQRVKKGTPLFAVASPDLAVLHGERAKARVDLDAARASLDRVQAMVKARAVPGRDQAAAEQKTHQAEVAFRLSQAKLAALRVRPSGEGEFVLSSPRDGVVLERNILPGQDVAPDASKPLILIADLSQVWILADLPETEAVGLRQGAEALVSSPSLPSLSRRGKVDLVSVMVDPERHTVPLRVRLENPDGSLRPNLFAQVRVAVGAETAAAEVPATAVITDGARQFVYLQRGPGQFLRQPVVAGSVREGRAPILSGLRPGQLVVVEGAVLLENQLVLAQ